MGADIYIQYPEAEAERDALHEQFLTVVKARDQSPRGSEEFKRLAEQGTALYDQMYTNNPYYFRDSYNSSSLLWLLNLSWWTDVGALLKQYDGNPPDTEDEDREPLLSVEGIRVFLRKVEALHLTDAQVRKVAHDWEGETFDSMMTYFTEKRQRLIDFLNRAIDLDCPLYCSC